MELIKSLNIALRFLIELCSLFAIGYWGFQMGKGILLKSILGIGAPLTIAVIWAMFGSPNASYQLNSGLRLSLELIIYLLASAAIYTTGRPKTAVLFITIALANLTLMYVWRQ
ncbi:YrdB family protein [Metabacillus fastidiosus]|uniref:YrdB family protein n=1 Tax=Metabacillus fastidiosus TaxID=1458 RepID=UPI003D2C423C